MLSSVMSDSGLCWMSPLTAAAVATCHNVQNANPATSRDYHRDQASEHRNLDAGVLPPREVGGDDVP